MESDQNKPLIIKSINPFVKIGSMKEEDPTTNRDHFIDMKDTYRIRKDRTFIRGEEIVSGYRLVTKGPGTFALLFQINSVEEFLRPIKGLEIVVEKNPASRMKCEHREHNATCFVRYPKPIVHAIATTS